MVKMTDEHCRNEKPPQNYSKITLSNIVHPYMKDNPEALKSLNALEALEAYSRSAIKNIEIPSNTSSIYNRLIRAIHNIPNVQEVKRREVLEKFPGLQAQIKLLDHCFEHYSEVLSGQRDYMLVLFPEGKLDLVESIYRNSPILDYYNQTVAEITKAYGSQLQKKPLRIIEVGAGTGSTTHLILPNLQNLDYEYTYTDVSFVFLNKAKNEFYQYPNLHFKIFNVEQELNQDMKGEFDIVIAANVLHATKDIKKTIQNVRALLKTGGIVIINEFTTRCDFSTLTFGLTPGWWMFEDYRIPDSPLLSSSSWNKLLKKFGFSEVVIHGDGNQSIIVGLAS